MGKRTGRRPEVLELVPAFEGVNTAGGPALRGNGLPGARGYARRARDSGVHGSTAHGEGVGVLGVAGTDCASRPQSTEEHP